MMSMRIALFASKVLTGGVGALLQNLGKGLASCGHEATVYFIRCSDEMRRRFADVGLRVRRLPAYTRTLGGIGRFALQLKRDGVQILHSHSISNAWLTAVLACRLVRVPNVHTVHQPFCPQSSMRGVRQRLRVRLATRFCKALVGVSQQIVESLRPYCAPSKLYYIPNGVSDMRLTEAIPPYPHAVVGTVTRLDPDKDPLTFLEAAMQARAVLPDLRFMIVGDGVLYESLRRWIEERNAGEYIQLLGTRSDIPNLLAQMSVFVLSSRSEGMPLAVLEAMSAQRPIIASAVGEIPTMLDNGNCGIITPPGDPQRLAQEIIRLVQDPAHAAALAARARQKYLECYTIEKTVSRYIQIYRTVLE